MAPAKAKLSSRLHFYDWEQALEQCELAQSRKESWAITLRWYLSWAKRARVAVDFDSARDFITQMELEKRPSPQRLEQWKEAIRWFFREGKRRHEGSQNASSCAEATQDINGSVLMNSYLSFRWQEPTGRKSRFSVHS